MRKYLIIVLLLISGVVMESKGQEIIIGDQKPFSPSCIIKLAPASLLDPDPTLQGAVEVAISPRLSLQQELGYGKFSYMHTDSDDPDFPKTVFRARTELRHYLNRRRHNPKGAYMAFEFFYKYVSQPHEEEISMGSYFQTMEYKRIKNVFGTHFKFGWQLPLSEHFLIDFYAGLGIRVIDIKTPNWQEQQEWNWFRRDNGVYTMPSMALGVKLGYLF